MEYKKTSHLPCDKCGSSDARTEYNEWSHCFSCGYRFKLNTEEKILTLNETKSTALEPIGEIVPLVDRGISKATAERYGVFKPKDSFYSYGYPLFRDGVHVANKYRLTGKKGFSVSGDFNKSQLFGQHVFPAGSAKTITVCEGQDDAMAAFELQGSKYPCVSVHSSSTARKDCAENFEYLNSFSEIILCFDTDVAKVGPDGVSHYPGQEAAQACAALFPAKKVRVLTLRRAKDANDYLKAGLQKEFVDEWWKAPTFTPAGLRLGADLWEEISTHKNIESIEYPFNGLNEMTYGLRLSEFVVITADTGVGKTSILKEIEYYILNHSKHGLGVLHLEESNADTGIGLMSLEANKPLHLPDVRSNTSDDELKQYYDKIVNTDRIVIYDHFGSNEVDDLLSKIRHMAALGCKYIVLDHLSIVVSDQSGDERKQLDEIATKLKTLCMELSVCVLAVIHQNRSGQIRGTAGVEQLANIVIKLMRDKESDDPWRRNITKVVVQKNRFCGKTGPATYLQYSPETGRLSELDQVGIKQYETNESIPISPFNESWV